MMRGTVLLVDDDRNALAALRRGLREAPFDVVTAEDGSSALDILATQAIDVVVSDEHMPGMSGTELLVTTRSRHPAVVRIMLTGLASVTTAIDAINEGEVFRFLVKPCESWHLARVIEDALRQRALLAETTRLLATVKHQRRLLEQMAKTPAAPVDGGASPDVRSSFVDLDDLLAELQSENKRVSETP